MNKLEQDTRVILLKYFLRDVDRQNRQMLGLPEKSSHTRTRTLCPHCHTGDMFFDPYENDWYCMYCGYRA